MTMRGSDLRLKHVASLYVEASVCIGYSMVIAFSDHNSKSLAQVAPVGLCRASTSD